jgi:hypothetical protein
LRIYEENHYPSSLLWGAREYGRLRYQYRTTTDRESANNSIENNNNRNSYRNNTACNGGRADKEKELLPIENKDQATDPTVTTTEPTEETKPIETAKLTVKNTAEEKVTSPIEETVPSTTPQLTGNEAMETEPAKMTEPDTTEKPAPFNINQWITFAKKYAASIDLALDSEAVSCWDKPIRAGEHCIYLERDIQSRLNRYAKDETSLMCGYGQKLRATTATTFILVTLKNCVAVDKEKGEK